MYETKKISLPSNGRIYPVKEIEIRNMTGADEKIVYSSMSEEAIDKLLKRCIIEPSDLIVSELCEQDKYFILMQIRILTYGPDYRFETVCTECGDKISIEMDLERDLEIYYADEDFDNSLNYTVTRKVGDEIVEGDSFTFKVLTSKDIREVNNLLAKIKAKNDKGVQYILKLSSIIDKINGKSLSLIEKQKYLEEASSRDIALLWKAFNGIKLGYNMYVYAVCPSCGETIEVQVVMGTEFFRPTTE